MEDDQNNDKSKEVEEIASLNFSLDNEANNNDDSQQVLDEIATLERNSEVDYNIDERDEIATLKRNNDDDELATLERYSEIDELISMEGNLSEIPSILQDNANKDVTEDNVDVFDSFEKIIFNSELLRGIYSYGFEKPSSIQKRAIFQIIKCHDVIALAPSDAGKSAAFSIGLLQRICTDIRETQALVLAHTRESAVHIQKVILALGDFMNVQCCACIGGSNTGELIRKLDYGQHVVTGTPGFIYKMIQRRTLRTRSIKILILDEADELLRCFPEQIEDIYRYLPENTQVVLVGKKLPYDLLEKTKKMMPAPVIMSVNSEINIKNCATFFNINVDNENREFKFEILQDLGIMIEAFQTIVFCNTRETINSLRDKLIKENITVCCLHSDLKSKERLSIVKLFYNNACSVLLTTDISFHGLNIPKVRFVINFDMPYQFDIYTQRIHNSVDYGERCVVINFVEDKDAGFLRQIEEYYKIKMKKMPLTTRKE